MSQCCFLKQFNFIPQGWQSEAGKIYSVSVSGIAQPIEYQVEMADCI